jgi:hypothetical protein
MVERGELYSASAYCGQSAFRIGVAAEQPLAISIG